MVAIIPSVWNGVGSGLLALGVDKLKLSDVIGKAPNPLHAALFGTTISLVDRVIEHQASNYLSGRHPTKKQTKVWTTMLIAVKILSPYLLRSFLEKTYNIKIPIAFIHLENTLYLAALADGEFENVAQRCFPNQWADHQDHRLFAQRCKEIHRLFLNFFGADA